jgi:hypothetical protein
MIFQAPVLGAAGEGLELVDYRLVSEGLERFQAALPRCPRKFSPPTDAAPYGMDLQQDWAYVPHDGAPWGTHCEEWDEAEAEAFNAAAARILKVVKVAHGWSSDQVEAADIWPDVPDRLSTLIRRTKTLLSHYERLSGMAAIPEQQVSGRSIWPWIVGGGLALSAVGGLALYSAPRKRRR